MESDSGVVQIAALRTVLNGILDFIEQDLVTTEVDLGKDHYWQVLDRDLYEVPPPAELGAGSLIDDWKFLMSAVKDKEQQLPAMLVHVAPILQALSKAVPSYRSPRQTPDR